jgi:predicted outer membrane repeat protein
MYVQNSSPLFTNTRFEGNTATGSGGGVFSESNSGPVFVNAHFESNVSSGIFSGGISYDGGGAIHSVSPASALLVNTTIENNRSILGPGGLLGSATDTVYNSVIRNNQGSAPGINNISGIPTGSFRKSLLEGESGGEFLGDSDIPGGGGPEHYPVAPGGALVSTSPAYPVLSALPSAVQDRVTNALTKDINGTGRFNNDNSIGLGAEKQ